MKIPKQIKRFNTNLLKFKIKLSFQNFNYYTAEQVKLSNNLDIINIPKTTNESLFNITSKLDNFDVKSLKELI